MAPESSPGKEYPAPLASHEEVAGNPALFVDSLRRFHAVLGTRFMIPVIGGKELDLHLLYLEVTKRGGLEKVVAERRWKEVIAAFNFPPTTTSASFVLRKYYISLLHHYEKVYYFGLQGPLVPPAVTPPAKSPACKPSGSDPAVCASDGLLAQESEMGQMQKRRKRVQIGVSHNFSVVGTIDGKFEHGYLVTVKLGSEVLRGVLFHPSTPATSSASPMAENTHPPPAASAPRLRRRKRGRRRWDPSHPKPNRSAYNFFFAEKHSTLKSLYPQREREFSKMIGESWNKLTDEERSVYQDCGLKDKERYQREMQEYRAGLKLVQTPPTLQECRERPKPIEAPPSREVARTPSSSPGHSKSESTTSDI